MSTALTISLIILVLVIAASVIALTVYVAKWLIELTLLTKNLNETTTVVKNELEDIESMLIKADLGLDLAVELSEKIKDEKIIALISAKRKKLFFLQNS